MTRRCSVMRRPFWLQRASRSILRGMCSSVVHPACCEKRNRLAITPIWRVRLYGAAIGVRVVALAGATTVVTAPLADLGEPLRDVEADGGVAGAYFQMQVGDAGRLRLCDHGAQQSGGDAAAAHGRIDREQQQF